MKTVLVRRALSAALLVLSCNLIVWSQLYTGSISGAVKDPSGNNVPNASITITSAANGLAIKPKQTLPASIPSATFRLVHIRRR